MQQTTIVANIPVEAEFISDSQEVWQVRQYLGIRAAGYNSFFVIAKDGDYTAIWGMSGIIPYQSKLVARLV
jgi:hypothetical protein